MVNKILDLRRASVAILLNSSIVRLIAIDIGREARVGQSPIPIHYGQPLFLWLSCD